jgi:hypothetical protein
MIKFSAIWFKRPLIEVIYLGHNTKKGSLNIVGFLTISLKHTVA